VFLLHQRQAAVFAAKGLSTRQIAEVTGWGHSTIAEDLKVLKAVQNRTESVQNRTAATGSAETKQHRAEVAEAAAAEGVIRIVRKVIRIVHQARPAARQMSRQMSVPDKCRTRVHEP
jgi:hypothetical protein